MKKIFWVTDEELETLYIETETYFYKDENGKRFQIVMAKNTEVALVEVA